MKESTKITFNIKLDVKIRTVLRKYISTMQAAMTGNSDNSILVLSSIRMRASSFIWEKVPTARFTSIGCII